MSDLFPDAPRSPRRTLLRVVDAGNGGVLYKWFVHLKCPACGYDGGWQSFKTREGAEGQPCPTCNKEADHG